MTTIDANGKLIPGKDVYFIELENEETIRLLEFPESKVESFEAGVDYILVSGSRHENDFEVISVDKIEDKEECEKIKDNQIRNTCKAVDWKTASTPESDPYY